MPFDMKDNKFVVNLFYASMFTENDLEALTKEIKFMNEMNPEYTFEIRKKRQENNHMNQDQIKQAIEALQSIDLTTFNNENTVSCRIKEQINNLKVRLQYY